MAVSVRLFAALREAAGTGEVLAAPGPLPQLLGDLCAEHGERFARVLGISSVLLDGTSVPRDADLAVPDGAELALLPPVSGGATTPRTRTPRPAQRFGPQARPIVGAMAEAQFSPSD